MENERVGPPREVLLADAGRPALSGPGNRTLASPDDGDRPRPRPQGDLALVMRRWMHAIPARLKAIFLRRRIERDLDDELAFHVAMQTRANAREGMTETEAYRRARVEIGGVEQVKERSRDVLPLRWLRDVMQDVRYGLRGLRKSPRFTIAAVLTVVLGVGANATIFSVLNPLLFKPLPYPEPERIVNVFRTSPQSDRWPH